MARWTRKPFAVWWTGRSPKGPTAWFRLAPPARAQRCRTRSMDGWSSGASRRRRAAVPGSVGAAGCARQWQSGLPGIAGAGSSPTTEAIAFTRHAQECGADAVLVVTPYYNKPTQEGLYQHFKAINDAASIPIIVYNIPARSVI